jgi:hypothetical protein
MRDLTISELVRGIGATPLAVLGAMVEVVAIVSCTLCRGGVTNRAFLLLSMSDGDDSAALWKVNRTIHELVKDRVQQSLLYSRFDIWLKAPTRRVTR